MADAELSGDVTTPVPLQPRPRGTNVAHVKPLSRSGDAKTGDKPHSSETIRLAAEVEKGGAGDLLRQISSRVTAADIRGKYVAPKMAYKANNYYALPHPTNPQAKLLYKCVSGIVNGVEKKLLIPAVSPPGGTAAINTAYTKSLLPCQSTIPNKSSLVLDDSNKSPPMIANSSSSHTMDSISVHPVSDVIANEAFQKSMCDVGGPVVRTTRTVTARTFIEPHPKQDFEKPKHLKPRLDTIVPEPPEDDGTGIKIASVCTLAKPSDDSDSDFLEMPVLTPMINIKTEPQTSGYGDFFGGDSSVESLSVHPESIDNALPPNIANIKEEPLDYEYPDYGQHRITTARETNSPNYSENELGIKEEPIDYGYDEDDGRLMNDDGTKNSPPKAIGKDNIPTALTNNCKVVVRNTFIGDQSNRSLLKRKDISAIESVEGEHVKKIKRTNEDSLPSKADNGQPEQRKKQDLIDTKVDQVKQRNGKVVVEITSKRSPSKIAKALDIARAVNSNPSAFKNKTQNSTMRLTTKPITITNPAITNLPSNSKLMVSRSVSSDGRTQLSIVNPSQAAVRPKYQVIFNSAQDMTKTSPRSPAILSPRTEVSEVSNVIKPHPGIVSPALASQVPRIVIRAPSTPKPITSPQIIQPYSINQAVPQSNLATLHKFTVSPQVSAPMPCIGSIATTQTTTTTVSASASTPTTKQAYTLFQANGRYYLTNLSGTNKYAIKSASTISLLSSPVQTASTLKPVDNMDLKSVENTSQSISVVKDRETKQPVASLGSGTGIKTFFPPAKPDQTIITKDDDALAQSSSDIDSFPSTSNDYNIATVSSTKNKSPYSQQSESGSGSSTNSLVSKEDLHAERIKQLKKKLKESAEAVDLLRKQQKLSQ